MQRNGFKTPIWKRALQGIGMILLIAIAVLSHRVYRLVNVTIPESYAAWTVGDLLVEYLQTHTNQWPRGWQDLGSAADSRLAKALPLHMPLERLPHYVRIDWQVDIRALQETARGRSNAVVSVVTQADGGRLSSRWGRDTEPNAKILRYLRSQ